MKKFITCLAIFVVASCSTQHVQNTVSSGRDGSSFEKAVIIQAKSDLEGTSAEYVWLKEHYPNYTMEKQELVQHNNKPYDVLYFKTQDGQAKTVYFDISNSFGKGF
jgi:hypothetical protein